MIRSVEHEEMKTQGAGLKHFGLQIDMSCMRGPVGARPRRFGTPRPGRLMHGIGLVDEHPDIIPPRVSNEHSTDGVIEENTILCVESYVGAIDGAEGVKRKEVVPVTHGGVQRRSLFPFKSDLIV